MNQQHGLSAAAFDLALNTALVNADISKGYEEYMAIFERFCSDEVEATSAARPGGLVGKARLVPVLLDFLIPLHVMAEVGGLSVSLRCSPIRGDADDEQHADWTLRLTGATRKTVTLTWSSARRWRDSRIVHERHYDAHIAGEPLTLLDFDFLVPA